MKLNKRALAYILMATTMASNVPAYADTVTNDVAAIADETGETDNYSCRVIDVDYGGFKIQSEALAYGGELHLPPEVVILQQENDEAFVVARTTGTFVFNIVDADGNELTRGTFECTTPTNYDTPLTLTSNYIWVGDLTNCDFTISKPSGEPIGWIRDDKEVKLITTNEAETTLDISSKSLAQGENTDVQIDLGTYSTTVDLNYDTEGPVVKGINWDKTENSRYLDDISLYFDIEDSGCSKYVSYGRVDLWRAAPGEFYMKVNGRYDVALGSQDIHIKDSLGNESEGFKITEEDIQRLDDMFPKEVEMEVIDVQPGADGCSVDVTLASTHALGGGQVQSSLHYSNNTYSNISGPYDEYIEDSYFNLSGPRYNPYSWGDDKNEPKDTKDYILTFNYKIPTWMCAIEGDGLTLDRSVTFKGVWSSNSISDQLNFKFNVTLPEMSLTKFYPDRVPVKFKEGTRHYYEPDEIAYGNNHRTVWVKSEDDFLGIDASNPSAWFDQANKSVACHSTDINFSSVTLSDKDYPDVYGTNLSYYYDNFSEINQVIIENPFSYYAYPYTSLFTIYPEVDDQAPEIKTPVGYRKGNKVEITIEATDTLPIDEGNKIVELLDKDDVKTYTFTDAVGNRSTITVKARDFWDNISPDAKPPVIEAAPKDIGRDEVVIEWKVTSEDGIKEITLPDGTKSTESEGEYIVKKDGDFKFTVESENGLTSEVIVPVQLAEDAPPIIKITYGDEDPVNLTQEIQIEIADDWGLRSIESANADVLHIFSDAPPVTSQTYKLNLEEGVYSFIVTDDRGQTAEDVCIVHFKSGPRLPIVELTPLDITRDSAKIKWKVDSLRELKEVTLPDGTKSTNLEGTFTVHEDGDYKFIAEDVKGKKGEATLPVQLASDNSPTVKVTLVNRNEAERNEEVKVEISDDWQLQSIKSDKANLDKSYTDLTSVTSDEIPLTLRRGTYTFVVTDDAGNTSSVDYTVHFDPLPPVIEVTPKDLTRDDGVIEWKVTSEDGIKEITLPDGTKVTDPTGEFPVTGDGDYKFIVEDNNGLTDEVTVPVKLLQDSAPSVKVTLVNRDEAQRKEEVKLELSDDWQLQSIKSDDINLDKVYTDLTPVTSDEIPLTLRRGTYTFIVTDDKGQTTSVDYTVHFDPLPPVIEVTPDNITRDDGVIKWKVTSEDGIKEITLPDGTKTTEPEGEFTIDGDGDYKFIVEDNNGLTTEETIPVQLLTDNAPTITVTTVNRDEATRKENIQVKVSDDWKLQSITSDDASLNKIYTSDTPVTSDTVDLTLSKGTYTFTATDDKGHTTTKEYTVDFAPLPPEIKVTPTNTTRDDAEIEWEATGEDGIKEITLPDGTKTTDPTGKFPITEDGDYKFIVEDNNGLTTEVIVPVHLLPDNSPAIKVTLVNRDEAQRKESIKLNISDDWKLQSITSDEAGLTKTYNPDVPVTSDEVDLTLGRGTYTFIATDDKGHTTTTNYTVDFEPLPPVIEATPDNITRDDAVIKWKVTSEDGIKEITLPDGTKVTDPVGEFPITEDGDYKIIVEDNNGLTKEVIVPIHLLPDNSPSIQITSINKDEAQRKEDIKLNISDDWQLKLIKSDNASLDKTYDTPVTSDTIDLTLSKGTYTFVATDDKGHTTTVDYTVSFNPLPPTITVTPSDTTRDDAIIKWEVTSEDGIKEITLPDGTKTTEPTGEFPVSGDGDYKFIVEDNNGLTDEVTIPIKLLEDNAPSVEVEVVNRNETERKEDIKIKVSDDWGIKSITSDKANLDKTYDPSTPVTSDEIPLTLGKGTYTFTITDDKGHTTTKEYTVDFNSQPPVIEVTPKDITRDDGVIEWKVTSEDGIKEIILPDGTKTTEPEGKFPVDKDGDYKFIVEDNNGLTDEVIVPIHLLPDNSPSIKVTPVDRDETNRKEDIKIELSDDWGIKSITSTSANLDKVYDTPVTSDTVDLTLGEGTYKFTVTDDKGKTTTVDYVVDFGPLPQPTPQPVPPIVTPEPTPEPVPPIEEPEPAPVVYEAPTVTITGAEYNPTTQVTTLQYNTTVDSRLTIVNVTGAQVKGEIPAFGSKDFTITVEDSQGQQATSLPFTVKGPSQMDLCLTLGQKEGHIQFHAELEDGIKLESITLPNGDKVETLEGDYKALTSGTQQFILRDTTGHQVTKSVNIDLRYDAPTIEAKAERVSKGLYNISYSTTVDEDLTITQVICCGMSSNLPTGTIAINNNGSDSVDITVTDSQGQTSTVNVPLEMLPPSLDLTLDKEASDIVHYKVTETDNPISYVVLPDGSETFNLEGIYKSSKHDVDLEFKVVDKKGLTTVQTIQTKEQEEPIFNPRPFIYIHAMEEEDIKDNKDKETKEEKPLEGIVETVEETPEDIYHSISFTHLKNVWKIDDVEEDDYFMDVTPQLIDGNNYIPVRYLALSFNIPWDDIIWGGNNHIVYIHDGSNDIQIKADKIVNGRALIKIQDIKAAFPERDFQVSWDTSTQTVTMTFKELQK